MPVVIIPKPISNGERGKNSGSKSGLSQSISKKKEPNLLGCPKRQNFIKFITLSRDWKLEKKLRESKRT